MSESTNGQSGESGATGSSSDGVTVINSFDKGALRSLTQGNIGENDDAMEDMAEDAEAESEEDLAEDEDAREEEEEVEGEQEDGDEDSEGESLEEAEIDLKGAKGVNIKLSNGKTVQIPKDAKILHKVDGVMTEISLTDALNREAGEITVEQRLSKLGQVESEFKRKESQLTSEVSKLKEAKQGDDEFLEAVAKSSMERPEVALGLIAERQGILPGEVMMHFVKHCFSVVDELTKKGTTQSQLEAQCHKINTEFLKEQREKDKQKHTKNENVANFQKTFQTIIETNNLHPSFLEAAIANLEESGSLTQDGSKDLKLIERVALKLRRNQDIYEVLQEKGLESNESLKRAVVDVVSSGSFTREEIAQLIDEVNSSSSTPTAAKPKVAAPSRTAGKPKEKWQTVSSVEGLARAFRVRS